MCGAVLIFHFQLSDEAKGPKVVCQLLVSIHFGIVVLGTSDKGNDSVASLLKKIRDIVGGIEDRLGEIGFAWLQHVMRRALAVDAQLEIPCSRGIHPCLADWLLEND